MIALFTKVSGEPGPAHLTREARLLACSPLPPPSGAAAAPDVDTISASASTLWATHATEGLTAIDGRRAIFTR